MFPADRSSSKQEDDEEVPELPQGRMLPAPNRPPRAGRAAAGIGAVAAFGAAAGNHRHSAEPPAGIAVAPPQPGQGVAVAPPSQSVPGLPPGPAPAQERAGGSMFEVACYLFSFV